MKNLLITIVATPVTVIGILLTMLVLVVIAACAASYGILMTPSTILNKLKQMDEDKSKLRNYR